MEHLPAPQSERQIKFLGLNIQDRQAGGPFKGTVHWIK
jgi:hypothetical protein